MRIIFLELCSDLSFLDLCGVVVRKSGKKLSSGLACVRKILRGIGFVLTRKQKDDLVIVVCKQRIV